MTTPRHTPWIASWLSIHDDVLNQWVDAALAGIFPHAGTLDPDDPADAQLIDYWTDIRDQIRDGVAGRWSWNAALQADTGQDTTRDMGTQIEPGVLTADPPADPADPSPDGSSRTDREVEMDETAAARIQEWTEAAGTASTVLGPISDAFLGEPDHLPQFAAGITYSAEEHREAFVEGIAAGREKAKDPIVRNRIIIAVATLGLTSQLGEFYAANRVLSQLWRSTREPSPGDNDTQTIRWPVPYDRNELIPQ